MNSERFCLDTTPSTVGYQIEIALDPFCPEPKVFLRYHQVPSSCSRRHFSFYLHRLFIYASIRVLDHGVLLLASSREYALVVITRRSQINMGTQTHRNLMHTSLGSPTPKIQRA